MRYALVDPQNAVIELSSKIDPNVQTKPGWRWLACPMVAPPAFDGATETLVGPSYTVGEKSATETWSKRALTAQEIDAVKERRLDIEDKLQFEVHFDIENRMRALEGKQPVTRAVYRAALKARL